MNQRNAVLIPAGSTEQHGLHLLLNMDSRSLRLDLPGLGDDLAYN